ncbi:hypothetical protein JTB14_035534 [Gonioctena quinquepunctata]|nr:hypothetical protein JTB14_035534 [Gonioctena quinquepunctata]
MMYPMVQSSHNPDRQPHIALISEQRLHPLQEQIPPSDEEEQEEDSYKKRPRRPFHRRVFSYVREAWTGVKSALGMNRVFIASNESHAVHIQQTGR